MVVGVIVGVCGVICVGFGSVGGVGAGWVVVSLVVVVVVVFVVGVVFVGRVVFARFQLALGVFCNVVGDTLFDLLVDEIDHFW